MALDEQLIQQLLVVFEVELEEQTQLMTTGLLALEKVESDQHQQTLKDILRSAHTIKGAAKVLGCMILLR